MPLRFATVRMATRAAGMLLCMSTIRGLRTLVSLKERRLAALNEALASSKEQLRQQAAALDAALQAEASSRAEEDGRRDALAATSMRAGGFRASDIVTLQHLLNEAAGRTAAAGKQVQRAEQQAEVARQHVNAAQQALRRGEQQLEKSRDRLKKAKDDIEKQQEDQQDEESEEAAVARMLAVVREASHGGDASLRAP